MGIAIPQTQFFGANSDTMPHQTLSLPLVLSPHQPMHLMAFVASALNVLNDTALQHWMEDLSVLVDNRGNWTTNNLLGLLREGRELMSQRVFLGQLHSVPLYLETTLETDHNAFEATTGCGMGTMMWTDPFPSGVTGFLSEHFAQTLLHEMCHAMFSRHSCMDNFGAESACIAQRALETGPDGHGQALTYLAGVPDLEPRRRSGRHCRPAYQESSRDARLYP
ncbi:hypothetical protein CKM354_000522200 [Cercospora kikuchii]|uniref:Uncharacterized protein n=1 Tax=Cercospora kikuchii TaxID=84275 RepID=A0A9P3FGK3_9PEZI|nr:uncharacterized protein CKM354_000522200 [Cercospora kikuchii]GIZ41939.1 hypothetical protein CKM354_000522200 [Cercospora kikuchii]